MASHSDAGRGEAGRPRKSKRSHEVRLFFRGRWVAADLRPWGLGRPTLRDPDSPHWPQGGDRTDSRTVAEEWVGAYLESVHRIHLRQRVLPRRLKAALDEFDRHRETTVELNTRGTDRTMRGHLLEFFGDAPIHEVPTRLQAFVDHLGRRGHAASTIATYFGSACAFLRWANLAIPDVALPAVPESDARYWSDTELVHIRDAADHTGPLARLAIELVLGTGARQQELFALRWHLLSERERTVRLVEQLERDKPAGGKPRPLKGKRARTALVLPAFWAYLDEGVLDWRTRIGFVLPSAAAGAIYRLGQQRLIRDILAAARLRETGVGWHAGRHTYSRLVLEGGGSLEQLRTFLGHRSVTTTERIYGHLSEGAAVRLARERIFGSA